MRLRKLSLVLGMAVTVAGASVLNAAEPRPRYIFINTTDNHAHDLALKTSLKIAEKRSGIENALILLDRLPEDQSVEEAALKLFEQHRIGQDRQGRGILYLYCRNENKFKIEVSYALEAIFPDGLCGRLEEAARTYMQSEIPQDFLSELLITMNIHGQDMGSESVAAPPWLMTTYLSGGAGSAWTGDRPAFANVRAAILALEVGDRAAYAPSTLAEETLERYLRSLAAGIGDPKLPLLTEGSQIFRMVVPRGAAQQRRVHRYFEKAMPPRLLREGSLALAVFRPGVANLPVVLRQAHTGYWYVDEPRAWTWFHRFEDGVDFFPTHDDNPFLPALRKARFPTADAPVYRGRAATPAPRPLPFSLEEEVAFLERRRDADRTNAAAHAALGELYLFEMNWRSRAIENFEAAARLAPDHLPYRWRLYDLYINNSEVEKALDQLRFLARALPRDAEVARWLPFYTEAYRIKPGEF